MLYVALTLALFVVFLAVDQIAARGHGLTATLVAVPTAVLAAYAAATL